VTPGIAFWRFGCSLLLGGCLGLWYGFLRPLGTKHQTLADVLFSLGAVWCWVCICFGICRGDIRFVFLLAMLGGLFLWEATFGRWLRPVFSGFWQFFRRLFRLFLFPWKKILEIAKILFASVKKWVTIKCTKICTSVQTRRKESHGKQKLPAQTSESGSSSCIQYP
jgi:hypothetical protein